MKTVIQRVTEASVEIDGRIHGAIEKGYMILVGICDSDTEETVRKMAAKISALRIFEDENGKMNLNVHQVNGAVLSISQFTLYADCHKGNRPSLLEQAVRHMLKNCIFSLMKSCVNWICMWKKVSSAQI